MRYPVSCKLHVNSMYFQIKSKLFIFFFYSPDTIDLCGPLLIRLLGTDPPVQLFITVKENFIEEKNLFGKVVQRLETRSLIG